MDPVSQGVIGAALAMVPAKKQELKAAFLVGWLSGMAPDLDVLISSAKDPLLAIEYHRHFTHSLLLAPVIGAAVATALHFVTQSWKARLDVGLGRFILFGVLGTLTHGFLDACTSYGTQLLWPFSNLRVAWHNVAIIDPIPTLCGLLCIVLAVLKASPRWAAAGFCFFVSYLLLGVVQRERAQNLLFEIARSRDHSPARWLTMPTIFNLIVFRSLYEFEGKYYFDAVRVPPFGKNEYSAGEVAKVYDWQLEMQRIQEHSPQRADLKRFAWFSDGFLALLPDGMVSDARYSLSPQSALPLWGIYLKPLSPDSHVEYWASRSLDPVLRRRFFTFLFEGNAQAQE